MHERVGDFVKTHHFKFQSGATAFNILIHVFLLTFALNSNLVRLHSTLTTLMDAMQLTLNSNLVRLHYNQHVISYAFSVSLNSNLVRLHYA